MGSSLKMARGLDGGTGKATGKYIWHQTTSMKLGVCSLSFSIHLSTQTTKEF